MQGIDNNKRLTILGSETRLKILCSPSILIQRGVSKKMSESVVELTDANFDTEALKADKPVLVDFWAPWCGPCRMVGPIIEELAGSYAGKVKVGKLNTDNNPIVASKYGIRSIPTILLLKNGEVVGNLMGAVPKNEFEKMIDQHLN